jgi:hypothetical protein
VHLSSGFYQAARRTLTALICATAFLAAGCHNNNNASGYGIAWVTVTDSPGDFTSYFVNIDSITLTRNDGAVVDALATPETVDFTKLNNTAELWGTATIPIGTYLSASIVLDYTNAVISVMVDGKPQQATVVDDAGNAVTTVTVNVTLDPSHPLVLTPTYATTDAQRLALDVNLAASTVSVNTAKTPAVVTVKPYITAAIAPPDNKLIRVRGPLINNSIDLLTYTVYLRPFYDEASDLGSLTLFTDANTLYTINGITSAGKAGIAQLSQSSAGSTVTAAYTTYTPTATPTATAAKYYAKYVIAGSTLEDIYTQGIEGDVIARSGDTLTLRGATLSLSNTGSTTGNITYYPTDSTLIVGPNTLVTADDSTSTVLLHSNAIAVGQHVIARGLCNSPCSAPITLNATGDTQENTGSVRLISTNVWGSLVSGAAGNLLLNVQAINDWPISDFVFSGNGATAASDPTGASFLVNTGAIALPATAVGDPLWIDGLVAPFGAAPPDFNATAVNNELSVQQVGAATPGPDSTCAQAELVCAPASMVVYWSSPGASAPFIDLGGSGMAVDLTNATFQKGTLRIGAETIDLATLPASPTIIPAVAPAPVTATAAGTGSVPQVLPPIFLPEYSYGDPTTVAPAVGISVFSVFDTFASGLTTALASKPALELEARGTYDRATNTFYAISVNVVL